MTYHLHNADFLLIAQLSPRDAKQGDIFVLPTSCLGFQGPSCRGQQNIVIEAGTYKIINRKGFRGGTQEIEKYDDNH